MQLTVQLVVTAVASLELVASATGCNWLQLKEATAVASLDQLQLQLQ